MEKKSSFVNVLVMLLIAIVIVGAGALIYQKFGEHGEQASGEKEQENQKAEIAECRRRMALFYKAWSAYKADHKNGDPPSIEAMIPKYIPDPNLLMCPTADRWIKKGKPMQQGTVVIDRKQYPVTYGFRWLSSGYARLQKKAGGQMPLIICEAHRDGVFRGAYNKPPGQASFDSAERAKLVPVVRDARTLVLRYNGTIDFLDPDKDN